MEIYGVKKQKTEDEEEKTIQLNILRTVLNFLIFYLFIFS